MRNLFLLCFFSSCIIVACKKESIDTSTFDKGLDYYPVTIGKYIIYSYDSIIYDNKGIDKFYLKGFIKEEIAEKISANDIETKYKLLKYWKAKIEDNWVLTDVESLTVSNEKIIKTEENLPFIKMVFPNKNNVTWNGNALFDDNIVVKIAGEPIEIYIFWDYKIINRGNPASIGGFNFNEVLDVVQTDTDESRERRYSVETFAKGIGLVKKEMKIYDTQIPQTGKPWEDYAEKGFSLVQTIIEHN
jgi:hypothetical protein